MMQPDNSLRPAKVSYTYVGTGGLPWGAGRAGGGGAAGFTGGGDGGIAAGGTFVYMGVGGTDVARVVEGPTSKNIVRFFEHVPSQSIHQIFDWSILAPILV